MYRDETYLTNKSECHVLTSSWCGRQASHAARAHSRATSSKRWRFLTTSTIVMVCVGGGGSQRYRPLRDVTRLITPGALLIGISSTSVEYRLRRCAATD